MRTLASRFVGNHSASKRSSRTSPLTLSFAPFCQADLLGILGPPVTWISTTTAAQAGSAAVAALYPAPAGAAAAAAKASRYALAAVCDRVCAEIAQAVRAALRGGGAAESEPGARPMFDESEWRADAEEAALVAACAAAWPRVRLLPALGHALPRVWEYGLRAEV
jgi:pyridoxal biosynthesis lyase PdxS